MGNTPVTLDVLGERTMRILAEQRELRDDVKALTRASVLFETLEERVTNLERWNTWTVRIVVGAVLAALMALVVPVVSSALS